MFYDVVQVQAGRSSLFCGFYGEMVFFVTFGERGSLWSFWRNGFLGSFGRKDLYCGFLEKRSLVVFWGEMIFFVVF